uniref:NTR domain-containing protein n=1 Tax=Plectus sambesii TaxID=2011161 RepID=A0A914X3A0_9BILA
MALKVFLALATSLAMSQFGYCCSCIPLTDETIMCQSSYVAVVELRSAMYDPAKLQYTYQGDQKSILKANFELGSDESLVFSTPASTEACGSPLELTENGEDNTFLIAAYGDDADGIEFGSCDYVVRWNSLSEEQQKKLTKENYANTCAEKW